MHKDGEEIFSSIIFLVAWGLTELFKADGQMLQFFRQQSYGEKTFCVKYFNKINLFPSTG